MTARFDVLVVAKV